MRAWRLALVACVATGVLGVAGPAGAAGIVDHDDAPPDVDVRTGAVEPTATQRRLARGEDVVPLVGARRRERLHEALGALELRLSEDDLRAFEDAVPAGAAAGGRYPEAQLAFLDSER